MMHNKSIKKKLLEIISQKGNCGWTFLHGCRISCPLRQQDGDCMLRTGILGDGKLRTSTEWNAFRYDEIYKLAVNEFVYMYGQEELIEVLM